MKLQKSPVIAPSILVQISVAVIVVALLILNLSALRDIEIATLCNVAWISLALVMRWVARTMPRGLWSISFIYLIVFGLFHFGLLFVTGLNLPVSSFFESYRSYWFYTDYTKDSIVLCLIAVLSLGIGMALSKVFIPSLSSKHKIKDTDEARKGQTFARIGLALMVTCVVGWFAAVISAGGTSLLVGAYRVLLDSMQQSAFLTTAIYYGLGVAMVLLAVGDPSLERRLGFRIFAFWGLFALPLGLRGEVLFPLATAIAIASIRKPLVTGRRAAVVVGCSIVLALTLIAFVKAQRATGIGAFDSASASASPFDALAEMGNSIRPVALCVQWSDEGDEFLYGGSYWAPIERGASRFSLNGDLNRIPAEEDPRVLNVLIAQRVSSIGFSPVAEAHRNFGSFGIPLVMCLMGLVIGRLDRMQHTRFNMAIAGIVLFPLLYNVRNAFISLPAQLIVGLLVVFLVNALANFRISIHLKKAPSLVR